MTLIVDNKNTNLHFILYLKKRMLRHVAIILNPKRLVPYDEYFNTDEFKRISDGAEISSRRIIMLGMTNLIHKKYESNTHIFINPNIVYPGTSLKVVDLCKVINFGTMSVDAYPIFSETFEHFYKNINKYLESCIIGLG